MSVELKVALGFASVFFVIGLTAIVMVSRYAMIAA